MALIFGAAGVIFGVVMTALKGYIIAYNVVRLGLVVKKFFFGK